MRFQHRVSFVFRTDEEHFELSAYLNEAFVRGGLDNESCGSEVCDSHAFDLLKNGFRLDDVILERSNTLPLPGIRGVLPLHKWTALIDYNSTCNV